MVLSGLCWWRPFTSQVALKASIFQVTVQHGPSLKGESVKEKSVLLAIKDCINKPRNKLEHHRAQLPLVRITWLSLWRRTGALQRGLAVWGRQLCFLVFQSLCLLSLCFFISRESKSKSGNGCSHVRVICTTGGARVRKGKALPGHKATANCTLWLSGLGYTISLHLTLGFSPHKSFEKHPVQPDCILPREHIQQPLKAL